MDRDPTPIYNRGIKAALTPRPAICAQCGQPFTACGRGKYCSGACRQRAYYWRHHTQTPKGAEEKS